MTPSGNESVNFFMVHFSFALNEGYKVFFSSNFSSSIFTWTINGVWYVAFINRFGELKISCSLNVRESLLWAIFLRFEIWQVFLLENICDVSVRMHECAKIGFGLKNCSWGQVVTRAWSLLWCILASLWTMHINSIFFSIDNSSSIFASTSNGVCHILHSSVGLGS